MVFHSAEFGVLLVVVLLLHGLLRDRRTLRTWTTLAASLVFYGWGTRWFVGLLIASCVLDYVMGRVIDAARSERRRKLALIVSVAGNLGMLGYFKYTHWLATSVIDPLLAACGSDASVVRYAWAGAVPVGISFYTFQTLSYTIDVFRRQLPAERRIDDFAFFVAFFPQLVAGPIVRAIDFLPQMMRRPSVRHDEIKQALWRIAVGLAKKALIADVLGRSIVDPVLASPGAYTPFAHLVACYAFTFQIYCDFSGYTDIAIGTAKLFGFDLKENFATPYRSLGVREFWRRWHISLSSWIRDYLWYPLGGTRCSEPRIVFNYFVTMVLMGLWHGGNTLCLALGVLQAIGMTVERQLERARGGVPFPTTGPRRVVAWVLTYHFFVLSQLLLRASDTANFRAMLSTFGERSLDGVAAWAWAAFAIAVFAHFEPFGIEERCARAWQRLPLLLIGVLLGALAGVLFLTMSSQTAFIYFQF
ncbi:MAG: MBOAT family protein [Planctomycetes bacterium]|nr:MBOAT family protein [Planctomycetota bacterium]MCC7169196.1 MBOAT family protein [Planctomycetota bacterium]